MAKSILHNKSDGTCYLCMLLNQDCNRRTVLEEHHVIYGTANRRLSEKYGLKVYLCPAHHKHGTTAVHRDHDVDLLLKFRAQREFEKWHSHEEWMRIFGRNYL